MVLRQFEGERNGFAGLVARFECGHKEEVTLGVAALWAVPFQRFEALKLLQWLVVVPKARRPLAVLRLVLCHLEFDEHIGFHVEPTFELEEGRLVGI